MTGRCRRGHSKWELVEKTRPAECEHEQRTGDGGRERGSWTKLRLTLGNRQKVRRTHAQCE